MPVEILTPTVTKLVDDYEFVMATGLLLPVTIDLEGGDVINFGGDAILITLSPKKSIQDTDKVLPGEDITIFTKHLVSVSHKTREVTSLTPDQQFEWTKTLKELGTIQ